MPVEATIIDLSRGGIDWDIYGILWEADTKLERESLLLTLPAPKSQP